MLSLFSYASAVLDTDVSIMSLLRSPSRGGFRSQWHLSVQAGLCSDAMF